MNISSGHAIKLRAVVQIQGMRMKPLLGPMKKQVVRTER
jgi:hypothetical protein